LKKKSICTNVERRIKKALFWVMFSMLLIGISASFFHVRSVCSGYENSRTTVDDNACVNAPSTTGDNVVVKVVEHSISEYELEELKRKAGVYENNINYNRIINGHGTGLRPPTESEWAKISEEALMVDKIFWIDQATSSPSQVDHTTTPWFPPIGNQNGEGSCVAWAVGYYVKTFQEAKEHAWDLSGAEWEGGYTGHPSSAYQDRIFSPDFIYHQINNGVDDGSNYPDAINLVCSIGACTWEKMPYAPNDSVTWPSEEAWREAPLYRGNSSGYEYMLLNTDDDIISLKNWIASDHLAIISIDADQYPSLTSEDFWTLDNYVNPSTNHANTIVGYDDNVEYTEEGYLRQGAFKIANSWGVGGWEKIPDGYYWISYEAMKQRVNRAMFYRDRIAYEPKIIASFRIDHSRRDDCDITLGIGNKSAPLLTKEFNDWSLDGGPLPFCSNDIVFDITEFEEVVSTVVGQRFFLKIFELGDPFTTGTIIDFSVEYYENYSSQIPLITAISDGSPVDTITNDDVYAEVTLLPSMTIEYPSSGQYVYDIVSITGNASQCQKQKVYTQDFNYEGDMPGDWETISEGPNEHPWSIELREDCRKDYWAECNSEKAGSNTNITELLYMTDGFNASGYSSLELEFYSDYEFYDDDEYAQVLYATSESYPTFYVLETWNSTGERHHHINLTVATGDPEIHLAFMYHGTYDWWVRVDNVVVYGLKTLDEVVVKIDEENWQIATGTTSWSCNWNATAYSDGNYTITARGYYGTIYTETSINAVVHNTPSIIHIDPLTKEIDVSKNGTISVNVTDALDLFAWQLKLLFNSSLVNCLDAWCPENHVLSGRNFTSIGPVIEQNYVQIGVTLDKGEPSFSGSGILCLIEIQGLAPGNCTMRFDGGNTFLLSSLKDEMPLAFSHASLLINEVIYVDQFFVSDDRCDVNSTQTVGCHAVYASNGFSVKEGAIWVNSTEYFVNSTGWCTFNVTFDTVGIKTWTVTDVSCNGIEYYEVAGPDPYIIFDKVNITLNVEDSWIDAGSEVSIPWTGIYEYDGEDFLGSITLNDSLTKNQVGRYGFTVASISDPTYGINAFESNEVYCIWDRIKISDGGVTHSSTNITHEEMVWFKIECEYNGSIPFSGTVYINDTPATYSILHDRWEYNYTLFSPGKATFNVSQIVDDLYGLTNVNDAVGPLSITWHHFQIIHDRETYVIPMTTNSCISNLEFAPLLEQIMFNVTGETGTMGYCNITIPKQLLKAEPSSAWNVLFDGYLELSYITSENETHTFIYINYTHSDHRIQIQGTWAIPEFPTIMILLLLMVSTIFVVVFNTYAKKFRP